MVEKISYLYPVERERAIEIGDSWKLEDLKFEVWLVDAVVGWKISHVIYRLSVSTSFVANFSYHRTDKKVRIFYLTIYDF